MGVLATEARTFRKSLSWIPSQSDITTRDIRWNEGDDDDDDGNEGGDAFVRQMERSKSLGNYESAGQTGGIFNLEFNTEGWVSECLRQWRKIVV